MVKHFIAVAFSGLLVACQANTPYQLVQPLGLIEPVVWTASEKAQPIATRHLDKTPFSSQHLVRLAASEKPHVHDRHDLTVTIMRGTSVIHFKDKALTVNVGDVVRIPAGTYHWAENIGEEASEVLVVFSPGFDGKDKRVISEN